MLKNLNIWFISSLVVSIGVLIPIITVFFSFFEDTSNYYEILKNTFLIEYIFNSFVLLISVLILTFLIGTMSAYLVSFYTFPFSEFFKWALILSFAVPPYIYAYSLTAFFENYGTAFTILTTYLEKENTIKISQSLMVFLEQYFHFLFPCLHMYIFYLEHHFYTSHKI